MVLTLSVNIWVKYVLAHHHNFHSRSFYNRFFLCNCNFFLNGWFCGVARWYEASSHLYVSFDSQIMAVINNGCGLSTEFELTVVNYPITESRVLDLVPKYSRSYLIRWITITLGDRHDELVHCVSRTNGILPDHIHLISASSTCPVQLRSCHLERFVTTRLIVFRWHQIIQIVY